MPHSSKENKKEEDQGADKRSSPLLSLGYNMLGGVLLFSLIGVWLYKRSGSFLWVIGGIFLGLIYCGYEVWKSIRNL